MAGLSLFRCGRIVCGFQVRRMPLNIAQVLAAASFVGSVIAASLGLGEPISAGRWLGIACNCFEIFVIGLTMQVYVRVATTRAETPMGGRSQGAVLTSNRKTLVSVWLNQPVLISFSLATRILSLRIRRRAVRIGRKSR